MIEYINNLAKLTGWVLEVYYWLHIAAFLLSWINADPYNSIVSFINRSTRPLWQWIGKRVPLKLNPLAPILALMLVKFGQITIPGIIRSFGAALAGAIGVDAMLKNLLFYLLYGGLYIATNVIAFIMLLAIVWFIFTLVNPPMNHPIIRSVMYLIDPFLTPLQRILPRASIDLSPVALAIITFFLNTYISRLAQATVVQIIV